MLTRIVAIVTAVVGLFVMTACAEIALLFIGGFVLFTAGCIATIGGLHDR